MEDDKRKNIINHIDILIDGRFELEHRDLSLAHKGSINQREIDVKKSLKENKVVLWND